MTVSKTIMDTTTILDIATSLPRSPDAPAYLRPAPPYVRSEVHLSAWCLQLDPATSTLRITVYWSWDLKGSVFILSPAAGSTPSFAAHLSTLIINYVAYVRSSGDRIPILHDWGHSIEPSALRFDGSRDTLHADYAVVTDEENSTVPASPSLSRVGSASSRTITIALPPAHGWDVHINVLQGPQEWHVRAEQHKFGPPLVLKVVHVSSAPLDMSRIHVSAQRVAASQSRIIRVNGEAQTIIPAMQFTEPEEDNDVLNDAGAGQSGFSVRTASGDEIDPSPALPSASTFSTVGTGPAPGNPSNAIASLVRRNYIYFTSLLQEPDAKWKPISDVRGVTVSQLDSIDPTLVVYRAEATFVGVGVWDLFATLNSPGMRTWEGADAVLIDDVSELSALWHRKGRASWPVRYD